MDLLLQMNQIMKMNKILVDNEICELKDFNGKLEFKNNSKVVIDGNCKVYVNKNINDLEFILNDNANLDIVFFDSDKCSDTKLIFNQNNSSFASDNIVRNAEAFYNKELYFKQKVNDKIENLKFEKYNKMAKAKNPYGDGFASKYIVDAIVEEDE